jgi:WD40 repeat protein
LGGVVLVDAADGTPQRELIAFEPRTEHRLAWSGDSLLLATGECRSRRIRLWHRAPDGFTAGLVLGPPPYEDPADGLCDLAFSPDGGLLACAHSNGDTGRRRA